MSEANPSTAMGRVLVDELARGGVKLFVISPGSRSAALAIAASEHPSVETRVILDERSAAFFALGRAKATGSPAAVVSTSGTAPANYLPAVVEADLSLTPLVVVSADRPAEMHGVGANQTIDQRRLFGNKVRRFAQIPAPRPGAELDLNHVWRSVAAEAAARSRGWAGRPGPVHLNVAFREPTVPVGDDGRSRAEPYRHSVDGREGGAAWLTLPTPDPPKPPRIEVGGAERPLLMLGEGDYDRAGVREQMNRLGWPVLATALSGMRGGDRIVTTYHHLLSRGVPPRLGPDLVVAVGAIGPSTRLENLAASAPIGIRVDRWGRRLDPERSATHVVHGEPSEILGSMPPSVEAGWAEAWVKADERARGALDEVLTSGVEPSGAAAVAALNEAGWVTLVAASSLPIREVDAHLTGPGRVIANRGASGIDGFVSTARGVASQAKGTVCLIGDLALLHDQNGFLGEDQDDLVFVVLDNGGGGLFDSLPQAQHAPDYERLFLTPHHRDLELLARFHDIPAVKAGDDVTAAVDAAIQSGGLHLVIVPVDRKFDLEMRRALDEAAAATL